MDEYIKREALIDALMSYTWRDENDFSIDDADEKRKYIEKWLPNCPAADVVPVRHGKWHDVYMTSPSSFAATCSMCGISNDIPHPISAHYCPNCGAKMDEEDKNG